MVFSFYYTEQIANIVLNKNPLMVTINEESDNFNVKSVNAVIKGDYIIPGINGLKVNKKESFYNMQQEEVFNNYYLVFEQVKPEISLDNYKDKIIKNGNGKLKRVSFIFATNNEVSDYFKSLELKGSMLTKVDSYKHNSYFEVINNETTNFKTLENTLNLNKENKHICVINETNKDICLKHKNYLVEPELTLTNNNLVSVKKNIGNGSIILVMESATIDDLKMLLKEVNYKGLEMVYLSEIISEENNN